LVNALIEEQDRVPSRKRFELFGESIREIGVLLLVFVPLDTVFYQGDIRLFGLLGLIFVAVVGFFLIYAGAIMEEKG
jgi:hypothetical protein